MVKRLEAQAGRRVIATLVEGRVDRRWSGARCRGGRWRRGPRGALRRGGGVPADRRRDGVGGPAGRCRRVHSSVRQLAFGTAAPLTRQLGYQMAAFILDKPPRQLHARGAFVTLTCPNRQVTVYPIRGGRLATFFTRPARRGRTLSRRRRATNCIGYMVTWAGSCRTCSRSVGPRRAPMSTRLSKCRCPRGAPAVCRARRRRVSVCVAAGRTGCIDGSHGRVRAGRGTRRARRRQSSTHALRRAAEAAHRTPTASWTSNGQVVRPGGRASSHRT